MSPVSTEAIWKASSRLADGREIVYFDEKYGLDRALARDTVGVWINDIVPEQAVR